MMQRKKLIEVALPLDAINTESLRRKQKAPKGWPTSFHKWWAQRPLAACRAVLFACLVDDPSSRPDKFATEEEQDKERERLLQFVSKLALWENSWDGDIISSAYREILTSTDGCPPIVSDPFCGSGSIPLEAQRLGLETFASDLNPVAVLITKATVEFPAKFANKPPVNQATRKAKNLIAKQWKDAEGLAEDVRFYGEWMRKQAAKRIGNFYPDVSITAEMAKDREDLQPLIGRKLTAIAWLWARTVKSPNPAFSHVYVPLASTFVLSSKAGKEAYVEPLVKGDSYSFRVKRGRSRDKEATHNGTKLPGANFRCLLSGTPIPGDYIKSEAKAGRLGVRLMAAVVEGDRGRLFLTPSSDVERLATRAEAQWRPAGDVPTHLTGGSCVPYNMTQWSDLFTSRQLLAVTTFSDTIKEAHEQVRRDAIAAGWPEGDKGIEAGGDGATAYADALAIYLACIIDRSVYYGTSLTTWLPKDNALRDCMPRQGLAMVWDFAEANPFGKSSGGIKTCTEVVANYLDLATPRSNATVTQVDARLIPLGKPVLVSTDPPYYDNISYADLSDFFYVWLRKSLKEFLPDLFATVAVPKAEELIAVPYRHGSKQAAESFFLDGMTQAMKKLANSADASFPITIYYAFKQAETEEEEGTASTGWETFLEAVINAGLSITGTWPLRTEGASRMLARGTNALASSIVLVCRPRPTSASMTTRREFISVLKAELPSAVAHFQRGNIAPVDLAQAAIGPGMAVYTRYSRVVDASGQPLPVREALALINQTLDEVLAEQEGDFDADTRWALAWFEQFGFDAGEYGVAETLSKAKNTSVRGMKDANILDKKSPGGKVRLLRPAELPFEWNPVTDSRLTVWEVVHHLVRRLESGGESAAAELVSVLGGVAEVARELAYRLYTICERKKRAAEALSYNGLVQSWPEISRLAKEKRPPQAAQVQMFQ